MTLSPAESFCQFFQHFHVSPYFPAERVICLSLSSVTEEMTIVDAHKLISEVCFFTGLIIVLDES